MSDSFDPVPGDDATMPPPGGSAPPPGGPTPPPGGPTPPEREPSRALYWLLGLLLVGVLIVIGFLAAIVFGGDEEQAADSTTSTIAPVTTTTVVGETTTTGAEDTTTTVAETTTTTVPETTTTTAIVRPDVQSPEEAARAYVTALGSGDTAVGWELLAPEAQGAIGSFENFDDLAPEFVEGFGAWSRAADLAIYENVMTTSVAGEVTVVTFAGQVNAEGTTSFSTLAIPIWKSGGGLYEVMWFAPRERTTFVAPEGSDPPAVFPADGTFEVLVPDTVTTAKLAVNDLGAVDGVLEAPDGATIRVTVTPDGSLPSGRHVLTVFTIAGDVMVADAVPFDVE